MALELQSELKSNLASLSESLGGQLPLDEAVLEGAPLFRGCPYTPTNLGGVAISPAQGDHSAVVS